MNPFKKFLTVIFITFTVFSCGTEKEDAAEDTAIAFFDAIYNQKDIKAAAALCAPTFATQILKYKTAKNVARRLFNMSFDSVKIDAALGDVKIREEFKNSGSLTLLFTGKSHGKIYKNLKRVRLIKKNKQWLVDQLLKDPVPN
jgi:hypothetical protein